MSEKAYFEISRTFSASQTNIARVLAPVTGNLVRAFVRSDTEMDGGSALFDVNKNGTTIFGDPDDRLKILDTEQTGDVGSLAIAVTQFTDIIAVDFDGFSGTAASVGGKLILVLEFEETGGGGGGAAFGAKIKLDSAVTINDDANPADLVTFQTHGSEVRDDGGLYDNGASNAFVIPTGKAGWYQIVFQAKWEGDATGQRRLEIWSLDAEEENAFLIGSQTEIPGSGFTDPLRMQVSSIVYLDEGWSVFFRAYQNSGGTLDLQATGDETWAAIMPAGLK